jgi:uncharacterized protein
VEYKIIDAHMHVSLSDHNQAISIINACSISKAVILNKGYGRTFPNQEHRMWEDLSFKILEKYPQRFAIFTTVDFSEMDEPDFGRKVAHHFKKCIQRGASGLKLWLGKPDHHWMALDDPRIGRVYETAAELNVPVLIHIGDPQDYWEEINPESFWYGVLRDNPQWQFIGKPVPNRQQLFEEQIRMLEKYPHTTFICPHLGGHAENLPYLESLLNSFDNLFVDTTAYEPTMGQNPEESQSFLIKFQDRIMFGTDNGWEASPLEIFQKRMKSFRLFYETDQVQDNLDDFMTRKPGYTIKGVNLPNSVLQKIYKENIERLVPKLSDDFA